MREARPGDLGRLLELYALLESPDGRGALRENGAAEDLFTWVLLDPNQRTLVAEIYGEVVGTLVLVTVPNLAHGGAPYALVENIVVDEECRGEGVGRALMKEALRRAREAGAYKLALCSSTERPEAHEFYRSMGFEKTHVGFEVRP